MYFWFILDMFIMLWLFPLTWMGLGLYRENNLSLLIQNGLKNISLDKFTSSKNVSCISSNYFQFPPKLSRF